MAFNCPGYKRIRVKVYQSAQLISLLKSKYGVVLLDDPILKLDRDDKEYEFQFLLRVFSARICFYYSTETPIILFDILSDV